MTLYVLHYCFSREFFEFVSILHVAMEFNNGNSEYFLSVMDFSFSFLSLFCLWVFTTFDCICSHNVINVHSLKLGLLVADSSPIHGT